MPVQTNAAGAGAMLGGLLPKRRVPHYVAQAVSADHSQEGRGVHAEGACKYWGTSG